jgi:predicted DNA-binding protein YlxM (UPF0122 family)
MEDKLRQGNLYEFYGELLNEHQKRIYEDYVLNDLSLGEISENEGITRQGVHDNVKRTTAILEDYEKKLGIVQRFFSIRDDIQKIRELLANDNIDRQEISKLLDRIYGEL